MTLPTTAYLPVNQYGVQPFHLRHAEEHLDNLQRRLSGRTALVPTVNLDDYRFRAVIDWVEFEVNFVRTTQAQHVQRILRQFLDRDSYINPMNEGAGRVFTACTIKIQEPPSLALVNQIHRALAKTFGEAKRSRLTGIEVSVDATPITPSFMARARLLGAMQRTIWTDRDIWSNPKSRPRSAIGRSKLDVYRLSPAPEMDDTEHDRIFPENHQAPLVDGTMYLGARDDDVMIRLMDKVIDRQRPDGTFDALREEERRVRIEVTLRGQELSNLGVTDVQSLRHLNLTRMQGRYFQFRLPTFSYRSQIRTGADAACNERQRQRANTYLRAGVTALMTMDRSIAANQRHHRRMIDKVLRLQNPTHRSTWKGKRLAPPLPSWQLLARKVHLALVDLSKRNARAWRSAR